VSDAVWYALFAVWCVGAMLLAFLVGRWFRDRE
jgi:hypothetical protein